MNALTKARLQNRLSPPMEVLHRKANRRARLAEARRDSAHDGVPRHAMNHAEQDVLVVSGAVTGAATGAIGGPPGAFAGAVIGAIAGAVIGRTLDREDVRKHQHDEDLDRDIGVSSGDMGAATPDMPKPVVGAYSGGSAGAGGTAEGPTPAEGPFQDLEGEE